MKTSVYNATYILCRRKYWFVLIFIFWELYKVWNFVHFGLKFGHKGTNDTLVLDKKCHSWSSKLLQNSSPATVSLQNSWKASVLPNQILINISHKMYTILTRSTACTLWIFVCMMIYPFYFYSYSFVCSDSSLFSFLPL